MKNDEEWQEVLLRVRSFKDARGRGLDKGIENPQRAFAVSSPFEVFGLPAAGLPRVISRIYIDYLSILFAKK